jgi:hypothetical protein
MANNINEIKRMQQLAGIVPVNEGIFTGIKRALNTAREYRNPQYAVNDAMRFLKKAFNAEYSQNKEMWIMLTPTGRKEFKFRVTDVDPQKSQVTYEFNGETVTVDSDDFESSVKDKVKKLK